MKRSIGFIVALLTVIMLFGCGSANNVDSGENIADLHFFGHHIILRVSDNPLFKVDGSIDVEVLEKLMAILGDPYLTTTAADFSNFVVEGEGCISRSGAIAIKLFETVPNRYGMEHGHLTELTSQWWQLVYRSTDDGDDVLTLWMMQPYRLSYFSGNRFEKINLDNGERRHDERFAMFPEQQWRFIPYNVNNTIRTDHEIINGLPPSNDFFFEGNFSASIARSNLLRDMEFLLSQFNISQYLVAPKDVPGNWQSSRYQTGTNAFMEFYISGKFLTSFELYEGSTYYNDGLGAAGQIWGNHAHFNILNGKDGLSIGPYNDHFPHTIIEPTNYDLLWLPSDFEIRSMGRNKDIATFQTFIAEPDNPSSQLRWNYITTRYEDWRYAYDQSGGRSGLWQLNGFDRGFNFGLPNTGWSYDEEELWLNNLVWLRSLDSFAIGNVNVVSYTGNRYGYGANQQAGLRPAVHLSLTELLQTIR